MDKAKHAVSDFMSKSGHKDTTVHEKVAPAVVSETINKQRHEETQAAIDREIHQEHYHTSVQPVKDREVLPEQHQHRMVPVEHREHYHDKDHALKESLEQERSHFRDTRTEGRTTETHATAPTVAGEHVHHHVHETIQPVVQKETIQPSVVHTTVPIHEVHHNDPKHHAASALPAVSMADFKRQGGSLTGREEKYDGFTGEPKTIGSTLGSQAGTHSQSSGPHDSNLANKVDPRVDSDRDGSRNMGAAQTSGTGYGSDTTGTGGVGPHSSGMANKADPRVDSDLDGSRSVGSTGTQGTHGTTGTTGTPIADQFSSNRGTGLNTGAGTTTDHKKPSLMDRLNPKKDTDRDGKAGFMD